MMMMVMDGSIVVVWRGCCCYVMRRGRMTATHNSPTDTGILSCPREQQYNKHSSIEHTSLEGEIARKI
jgi:hypothetical protein